MTICRMRAVVNSAGVLILSKVVTFIILYFPVNYRGSVGFGQSSLLSLPGNIGTQDVRDVQVTLMDVVDGLIVRYINNFRMIRKLEWVSCIISFYNIGLPDLINV